MCLLLLVTSHSLRKEAYLGKLVCLCYWFLSELVYDPCPEKSISKAHLFITQKALPCLITLLSPGLAMNSSHLVSKIKSTLSKWGLAPSNNFPRDVLQLWGRKGLNPERHYQWCTALHGSCFKAGSTHQNAELLACLFFKNQPGYLRVIPGRSQLVWHSRLAQEASCEGEKTRKKAGGASDWGPTTVCSSCWRAGWWARHSPHCFGPDKRDQITEGFLRR